MLEALATWQWNNFLEVQAAPGQVVVHINLDETSVKLCPNVQPGAVAVGWHRTKKEAMEREQKANLKARRSALTFVCCVCDDEDVQRSLPQVIIGPPYPLTEVNRFPKGSSSGPLQSSIAYGPFRFLRSQSPACSGKRP